MRNKSLFDYCEQTMQVEVTNNLLLLNIAGSSKQHI